MAETLKVCEYEVNGVKHTAQLSAEDQKRYGAKVVPTAQKPSTGPESKAGQTPPNK